MRHLWMIAGVFAFAFTQAQGGTPHALKITPLPDDVLSGASCALLNPKGEVLTDGLKIIIDGRGIRMGKPAYDKKSKTWIANNLEITYSTNGELLESASGFTPGKSRVGQLTIKQGQLTSVTRAHEVCQGDM